MTAESAENAEKNKEALAVSAVIIALTVRVAIRCGDNIRMSDQNSRLSYDLVAIDVDGTLLDSNGDLSDGPAPVHGGDAEGEGGIGG